MLGALNACFPTVLLQYDASLSKTADPLHPHDHGNTQDSKLTLEASGEGNTQVSYGHILICTCNSV